MRTIHNLKTKKLTRKELRKITTPQEIILWSRLRRSELGHRFRRQHSMGKYIVDFYCPEKKLIIELDGWQHKEEKQKKHDTKRNQYLEDLGFKILRFWNNEINNDLESVIIKILDNLN